MDARGGPDRPRGSASQGGALTAPASDRRTYPPSARLKRRGEYLSVQTAGRKLYSKHFVILVREGESTALRRMMLVGVLTEGRCAFVLGVFGVDDATTSFNKFVIIEI